MRPDILVVAGGGGGCSGNVCGRHLKYGYNVCKISWVSQAKMVSKCNRIASLVIFSYNPPPPPQKKKNPNESGTYPLSCSSPTRAFGTRWTSTAFNDRTTSKSRRRPRLQEILCFVLSKARESMQASEGIQNFEIHNLAVMLLVLGIVGISRKLKQELKMSLRHTCRTFK